MWKKLDWPSFLFIALTPVMAVLLTILHVRLEGWNSSTIYIFLFFYILTGISITACYHRLYAHRSYETCSFIKGLLLFFGAGAWQNSALKWCSDHRRHHQFVDTGQDPYNIKQGFLYAHVGWVVTKQDSIHKKYAGDLMRDPLVMWQHKYYLLCAVLVTFILPLLLGFIIGAPLGGLALGGFVRLVLLHHVTFLINSLCHYAGDQTYSDENTARDCWFIAPFSYGECYHNFHHHFQNDYRNGVRWYHFDMTKWFISTLDFMGLAKNLNRIPQEMVFRARLNMEEKKMKKMLGSRLDGELSSIEKMKLPMMNSLIKMEHLRKEAQIIKNDLSLQGKEKLKELQSALRRARHEFKIGHTNWIAYTRSLST